MHMFRAPKALSNQCPYVLLGFKLHIYIYSRVCLFKTYQNINTFAWMISIVLEHSSKKPQNHMFRAPPSPSNSISERSKVLNYVYILPCLSLQDLSEYMYFCIKFLNSSRTFVKKASKSHVSCTPEPFKFNFRSFY